MDEELRSLLKGMEGRLEQKLTGLFADLDLKLSALEQRTDQTLSDHEQRTNEKSSTFQQHLMEKMHDMQNELLRGFEAFTSAQGIRLRKLEVDQSNLDAAVTGRMAILEARLRQIEFRMGLSLMDTDPPKQ